MIKWFIPLTINPEYAVKIDYVSSAMVVVIVILLGWIAFFYWDKARKRKKNREKYRGRVVLCIVPPQGGKARFICCEAYEDEAKEITDQNKGNFLLSVFAKPPGEEVEPYQLWADFEYMIDWPPGADPDEQIPMMMWFFRSGDTAPQLPHDAEKYNVERVTKQSTAFSKYSREVALAQAIVGQLSGFFKKLFEALPLLMRINWILWMQVITVLGIIGMAYFAFQNMSMTHQSMDIISAYFRGK